MIKRLFLAVLAVLTASGISLKAQIITEGADAVKEINRIKTLSEYIYAEATAADRDTAMANAAEKLLDEIRYAVQDSLLTAQALESKRFILTKRGSLTRAFVYTVRPLNIGARRESAVSATSSALSPTPAVTGPKPDSPVLPVIETNDDGYVLFAEETRMIKVKVFSDIKPYIEGLSLKNILKDYGKYADLPSTGECYLFVYNKDQKVVACLKRMSTRQINLVTRQTDDVKNYKNCGAIWFTLK